MINLIRPVNLLLLFAVQFTLWFRLCPQNKEVQDILDFIILTFSVICAAAAGYIINDIFDIKTDLINKAHKVFIGRKISNKSAFFLFYLSNSFALALAIVLIDFKIVLITILAIFLLYLYSKNLKNSILIGNLTVAFLSVLPIAEIYLYFDAADAAAEFLAYTLFAFFTTFLREIVKDGEDREGDLKSGIKTLANSISDSRLKLVLICTNFSLLICLLAFPIFVTKFSTFTFGLYLALMILPALIIFVLICKLKHKNRYSFLSLFIKIYMFLGLIRLWI